MKGEKPPQPTMMKGGAREYVLDIAQKFSHPIQLYVLVALAIGIAFSKEIPIEIRSQSGTTLGRIFLFLVTILITERFTWVNGLLTAVLVLLLISLSPRVVHHLPSMEGFAASRAGGSTQGSTSGRAEGFANGGQPIDDSISLVTDKKRWFVEEVLKEHPIAIEKEKVRTSAIQDNTNSSASFTAQGGSK